MSEPDHTTDIYETTIWNLPDGNIHRLDGPAIEYPNGEKSWFYKGIRIFVSNQKEFERWLRLKAFW